MLQNNGKHILWDHISHLYEQCQSESGLYVGHRLTYEHIHLSSFSKMKVNLAAQVCKLELHANVLVKLIHSAHSYPIGT